MKSTFAALTLFLFLLHKSNADENIDEQAPEDPYLYNEADFQETVGVLPHFVMFFAPWCGHCKALKPAWNELSEYYNVENTEIIKVVKVDCTIESKLCSDNDVTGYPTLKLFQPGKASVRYKGSRDIAALKQFISASLELDKNKQEQSEDGPEVNMGLYDLTSESFDSHIATGSHFVKFFAPWCGHCKRLEPVWKELAAKFESSETVKISRVDCTQHQKVCSSNGVRGYPTLIWFQDGKKITNYEGGRQLDNFLAYIEERTSLDQEEKHDGEEEVVKVDSKKVVHEGEQQHEISEGLLELTNDNIDLAIDSGDIFIKFFAPWCGHCRKMEPAWKELAKFFEDTDKVIIGRVDCTKNSEVCQSNGVRGYPTLKYFRDGEAVSDTPKGRDFESLKSFVKKMLGEEEDVEKVQEVEKADDEADEVVDGLYELTATNYKTMTSKGDFFIKFFAPWCGHCRKMEPAWKELAKIYGDDETVHIGRVDCTQHSSICGSVGVRGYPTLKYFRNGDEIEGTPSGRDLESLKRFVEKMSGEQEEQVEEVEPQKADPGAPELDAATFVDVIETGVTFVKFYAPWCGHCKRLAPVWDELAREDFSQVSEPVRIVKIDCTKHNSVCGDYEVRGYPTLKLFKAGEEKAKYGGARTLEALKQFVIDNTAEAKEKLEAKDEL